MTPELKEVPNGFNPIPIETIFIDVDPRSGPYDPAFDFLAINPEVFPNLKNIMMTFDERLTVDERSGLRAPPKVLLSRLDLYTLEFQRAVKVHIVDRQDVSLENGILHYSKIMKLAASF